MNELWAALDRRYGRVRQRSTAIATSVQRDSYGKAYGVKANIDGLGEVPVAIGYGEPVSRGSRFEVENIGTPANPNWQTVRSVQPFSPTPTMAEIWEDDQIGGYLAGDLLVGDITDNGPNLFYSPSSGNLSLRNGTVATITLFGSDGSARFGLGTGSNPNMYWDATGGELSIRVGSTPYIRFDTSGGFIDGRLAVTEAISNSATDSWDTVGSPGFWMGISGGFTRFRLGTYVAGDGAGNYMYWDEQNNKLYVSGTIKGTIGTEISATLVTIADAGGYYTAVEVESALQEIGTWDIIEGDGIKISNAGLLYNDPSVTLEIDGTTLALGPLGVKVDEATSFAWTGPVHSWSQILRSSQLQGGGPDYMWSITGSGVADFRSMTIDELFVDAFIADVHLALAGSQTITKSLSHLSRSFVVADTVTIYVKALPGYSGYDSFANGDTVRIRYMELATGLVVSDVMGTVVSYDPGDLEPDEQGYTLTKTVGTNGWIMQAGALILDYGVSGDGFWEVTTLDPTASVVADIATWTTDPRTPTVHVRLGDMTGTKSPDYDGEWGMYAGPGVASNQYLIATGDRIEAYGLGITLYNDDVTPLQTVNIFPGNGSQGPYISVGTNAESITYNAGTGFWVGEDGITDTYRFKIGDNSQYIRWDGVNLEVSGTIRVIDGSDVAEPRFRPSTSEVLLYQNYNPGSDLLYITGAGAIDEIDGTVVFADGTVLPLNFLLTAPGNADIYIGPGDELTLVVWVKKTGVGSIETPYFDFDIGANVILTYIDKLTDYLGGTPEDNVVVAYVYLTTDHQSISSISGVGEATNTFIGPGRLITDNISSISANLGSITGGSMVLTNGGEMMWLNYSVTGGWPALAIGGTDQLTAPFRVYADGRTRIGDATNYVEWNSPNLTVKGTINADAGYIGTLDITGNLTVTTGGIYFLTGGWGKLEPNGIVIHDRVNNQDAAILRIAKPQILPGGGNTYGLIDVRMYQAEQPQWNHAIYVSDGSNDSPANSSLFHGESSIASPNSVDRIFDAITSNLSESDGFYGYVNGGYGLWASQDTSSYFGGKGTVFKGEQTGTGPVAMFNRSAHNDHPAVWATVDGSNNAAVFKIVAGSDLVRGIDIVADSFTSPYSAVKISGHGKIHMDNGHIEFNVRPKTDVMPTPGAGVVEMYAKNFYISGFGIDDWRTSLVLKLENGFEYYFIPYRLF